MATVYLAADLKHERKVAIKVLKPELAAVLGAERFVAEIKTTASLSHPHILPLFDSGTADGFLYYVMPYIEGETIRDLLNRETQLGVDQAVHIAREVADALDYAHRRGVIHRDIKPENILLHDGRAMVMDFGIALAVSAAAGGRMTETGLSLGTPPYMSPEQATADKEISGRSDIYSLATVLFEMLAGEPPHIGASAQQIIMKIITEEARPVTRLRKSVPPNVSDALMRALEKLPADRFSTAKEFSDALANATYGTSLSAAHVPRGRSKRPDWRLAAVAGLLLGAVSAWVLMPRTSNARTAVEVREQVTFNGRSVAPAISPDGNHLAYVERHCPNGMLYRCKSQLISQERLSNRQTTLIDSADALETPRFSPDGQFIYVNATIDSVRSGLYAIPRLVGVPRKVRSSFATFDLHSTGDSLIAMPKSGQGKFARIVVATTGDAVDSIPLPPIETSGVSWSPDGKHFAVVSTYTRLFIISRQGQVTDSLSGTYRPVVRWAADGRGVLVFHALPGKEDDLEYYPVNANGRLGPRETVMPKVPTMLNGEFDIARNTGMLVLANGSLTIDLWTFDFNGNGTRRTSGTTWYGAPGISPDGTTLYYQRGDAIGDNVYRLLSSNREEPLTADSSAAGSNSVVVSRDGRRIAFAGATDEIARRITLLDVASRQIAFARSRENAAAIAPVGRGAVYLTGGDELMVLDSVGAKERKLQVPDSLLLSRFAMSPDDRAIALMMTDRNGYILATTPIDQYEPQVLHRFQPDEVPDQVSWGNDGWISFGLLRGNERTSLWRIRASGGPIAKVTALPANCNGRWAAVAAAAPRGVCLAFDMRPDIWTVTVERLRK